MVSHHKFATAHSKMEYASFEFYAFGDDFKSLFANCVSLIS